MGRQIALAATRADEQVFLAFLRGTAEIAILESFAETQDKLWVDNFSPQLNGHWTYTIWNKSFSWEPAYKRIGNKSVDPSMIGWYYTSNRDTAPIIEFSRSDIAHNKFGRVYWAKDFAAPQGLVYDTDRFSKWFDDIVRWVRKAGRRDKKTGVYFLSDAFQRFH